MTAVHQALEHLQAALEALGAPSAGNEVDRAARAILEAVLRLAGELAVPEHLKASPALQYLTEQQLCERVDCSRRYLQDLRRRGGGPKFIRLGHRPLYSVPDVLQWEARLPVAHTSAEFERDRGKGVR